MALPFHTVYNSYGIMRHKYSVVIARTEVVPDTGFAMKYHTIGAMTPLNAGSLAFIVTIFFGSETFFGAFFSACFKHHTGWTFKIWKKVMIMINKLIGPMTCQQDVFTCYVRKCLYKLFVISKHIGLNHVPCYIDLHISLETRKKTTTTISVLNVA